MLVTFKGVGPLLEVTPPLEVALPLGVALPLELTPPLELLRQEPVVLVNSWGVLQQTGDKQQSNHLW